jgi:hypothetical protein
MTQDPERLLWQVIYRSLMAIAEAIKRYKLGNTTSD